MMKRGKGCPGQMTLGITVLSKVGCAEAQRSVIDLCRFTCGSLTIQSTVPRTLVMVNPVLVSQLSRLVSMKHRPPQLPHQVSCV